LLAFSERNLGDSSGNLRSQDNRLVGA
jgi:hypothetical protein